MTVAVVLSLPALPAPAADLPGTFQGVRRIVALGDSITEAGGEAGGYVWLLERYLSALDPTRRIEVVNAGVGGHKSTDMAARFTRDVLDRKPDLVTISVGINDVWHAFRDFQAGRNHPAGNLPAGVPLPVYRTKLQTMIEANARTLGDAARRNAVRWPTTEGSYPDSLTFAEDLAQMKAWTEVRLAWLDRKINQKPHAIGP